MTVICFGTIEFERPKRRISADDVKPVLATSGKQVLRLAWGSLMPNERDDLKREELAPWLVEVSNVGERDSTARVQSASDSYRD